MDSRLLDVAQEGNVSELQKLLQEDPQLERLSVAGYLKTTVLHIASANGFAEIVRELLTSKPELARHKRSDGRTSLHCAVKAGRVQVIKELVGICPDCISDVTLKAETALHLAVKYNQFEAFKAMVDMNKKELLNAVDEDGNTVLHLAVATKQSQTLKLLLGGGGRGTNKSGLTALDVMVGESTDSMIRDLLTRAGALRASKEVERQFLLHEISLLSPCRCWKKLEKEVKNSPPETKNALLVVAVIIASLTYQAILNPPAGFYTDIYRNFNAASSSFSLQEFLIFMVPNSIGFFVSLAVINISVMDRCTLLGIAVRCLAASYLFGLLFIGPTSAKDSLLWMAIIGIIVLVDLVCFVYCLVIQRWCKESYLWVTIIGIITLVELVRFVYWWN